MEALFPYLGIIVTLIIMEGLLSADNALVLAVMTNKLKDPVERKKALFYGMWGAVGFRALFIFLGTWIAKFWFIKAFGAFWLFKIAYDHFAGKEGEVDVSKYEKTWAHRLLGIFGIRLTFFWSIVISVEIMDLAFSVDSILAALALSDKFWVLLTGGVLGIFMMRGVAQVFQNLIERVPEMEHTAFILVALIGLKMASGIIHNIVGLVSVTMHEIHIGHNLFFGILVATFALTFIIHWMRGGRFQKVVQG